MKLYNYDKSTREKIESLPQGFFLSYDSQKNVVLSIKAIPGLISSLIKGCSISLYLTKDDPLVTLFIVDNPNNPYYFKGNNFSAQSKEFGNVETIIIDLIKATSFKLIILNETNYQIVNADITKENSQSVFNSWQNADNTEFEIEISNLSFKDNEKIIYIDSIKNEIWNNQLIDGKPYFKFNEYSENGKHGYNQEFSIRNILSEFYDPNLELFPSVMKTNGDELTDFIVIFKKAIVIIESKFTISDKQTKFNDAISKAIKQLNLAEEIITQQPDLVDHSFVRSEIENYQVILKICVFYDDGRNLKKAFQNIEDKYALETLPIFFPINFFDQYMSYLKNLNIEEYKYNIIENLLRIRIQYRQKGKPVIIDGVDLNKGAITFIH